MSTNAHSGQTESSIPNKFYMPGAASTGGESRIEQFVTALYEKHELFTRRLE